MWVTHKQEHQNYILWVMWVIWMAETHITHNWEYFGKRLGTGLQSVGHVGNLPIHFKSLAYNIRVNTIYKIQFLAIYPFNITHNTHKQAGSGSPVNSDYPQQYPQQYPPTTPKTLKTPRPYQCSKNSLRLTDYWSKIRRAVEVQ
jgi:hypothetical protein